MIKKILSRLNPFHLTHREKIKLFLKKPLAVIILLLLLTGAVSAAYSLFKGKPEAEEKKEKIKQVETMLIDLSKDNTAAIKTVGAVKAETKVEITANVRGTVQGVYFNIGDKVSLNSLLVSLHDSATLTSLNNAQINYLNMQNNLGSSERISEETIAQAEISVQTAKKSVEAAEISVQTAKNNFTSGQILKQKSKQDTKNNAMVSFNGFLNTIFNALNQVNYLIKAEGTTQLANVEHLLGVKNTSSLNTAKADYFAVKNNYENLIKISLSPENITASMSAMNKALSQLQILTDSTLVVLNNTVTSTNFNDTSLETQKTNFIALRTGVISAQNTAAASLQALENLEQVYDQEISNLESAVLAAEKQLEIAKTNYNNTVAALENTKQGKKQQVLSSQISLDGARGQLNLVQTQAGDLSIKAPITGQITKKNIEIGTDVNPGQVIAEIQQAQNVIVTVDLSSEDIYRVEKNQAVEIGGELSGTINSIAPAADPITRKVKVEILYNNENNDLIPGTFIEVSIPVRTLEKTGATSIYIPLRAVNITQNENYVFIAKDNQAKKIPVQIGRNEGALIEVMGGLTDNDRLIIDGGRELEDGEQIEIKL